MVSKIPWFLLFYDYGIFWILENPLVWLNSCKPQKVKTWFLTENLLLYINICISFPSFPTNLFFIGQTIRIVTVIKTNPVFSHKIAVQRSVQDFERFSDILRSVLESVPIVMTTLSSSVLEAISGKRNSTFFSMMPKKAKWNPKLTQPLDMWLEAVVTSWKALSVDKDTGAMFTAELQHFLCDPAPKKDRYYDRKRKGQSDAGSFQETLLTSSPKKLSAMTAKTMRAAWNKYVERLEKSIGGKDPNPLLSPCRTPDVVEYVEAMPNPYAEVSRIEEKWPLFECSVGGHSNEAIPVHTLRKSRKAKPYPTSVPPTPHSIDFFVETWSYHTLTVLQQAEVKLRARLYVQQGIG